MRMVDSMSDRWLACAGRPASSTSSRHEDLIMQPLFRSSLRILKQTFQWCPCPFCLPWTHRSAHHHCLLLFFVYQKVMFPCSVRSLGPGQACVLDKIYPCNEAHLSQAS